MPALIEAGSSENVLCAADTPACDTMDLPTGWQVCDIDQDFPRFFLQFP